jgi:hypothetical protein
MNAIDQKLAPLKTDQEELGGLLDAHSNSMLVGSVDEGFANATSDIDIIVLTDAMQGDNLHRKLDSSASEKERFRNRSARSAEGLSYQRTLEHGAKLQVQIVPTALLHELHDVVNESVQWLDIFTRSAEESLSSSVAMGSVTTEQLKLLHRVHTGTALKGADEINATRASLSVAALSRYVLLLQAVALGSSMTDLQGVVSEPGRGAPAGKVLIGSYCLARVGWMILAAVGETNVSDKLLFKLLAHHSGQIGSDLTESIAAGYTKLFSGSAFDEDSYMTLMNRALDFVEARSPFVQSLFKSVGRIDIRALS